jgi:hypothetical protein
MAERKQRPIQQIMDDPNKGVSKTYGAWGLLSKLWRIILRDNHMNGYRFNVFMDRFLKDPKNQTKKNADGEHFDNRGNLNKEFSNPTMSWKVFTKCLKFIQANKVRVTVEIEHPDGHISMHRTMVDLHDNMLMSDPRFAHELEDQLEAHVSDPNAPNLPIPDDQEPIIYLDPHPDDEADAA